MPLPSTKAGWDDHLVFPRPHGVPSRHAPVCAPAAGMCAIPLPVGSPTDCLRSGRRDYFVGCYILHLDPRSWGSVHDLSIPNSRFSDHPPRMGKVISYFIAHFSRLSRHLTNLHHHLRPTHHSDRTSGVLNVSGHSGPESTSHILDSDCIAWMLEMPLPGIVHAIALEFLVTLPFFQRTNPAVIIRCLDLFLACLNVENGGWAVVPPRLEFVANAAATALLHILVQLHEAGSGSLDELRRRYRSRLPEDIIFAQQPPFTIVVLHFCMYDMLHRVFPPWPNNSEYSHLGHETVSKALMIRSKQLRRARGKVPRWILRFVFDSLTRHALPSDAVISNCFLIVSEDLGGSMTTDER